ncbi:IS200/IS605 family element transposase accessory protein TnpB [Candidatus Poribacteria bacterium]|nr:IS200/IS605 family element transposase accessory protein TnpB [Candidatus Poribacteria bacterium]
MKLIAAIKLNPTETQTNALKATLERANEACNYISEKAWEKQTFNRYKIQQLCYYEVKEQFKLSAQLAIRCIAKVADAYLLDKKMKRVFKRHGSIAYDDRILKYYADRSRVSIWTLEGREHIPFECGERQRALLQSRHGESDLIYRNGNFYLFATCAVEEPPPDEVNKYLGVDLGVVNIAVDSDGEIHTAEAMEKVRIHYATLKGSLQRHGSKNAKRKLKKRSGREKRFRKDRNHCISKHLVEKAKDTKRGIALEDLNGIRERTTVRKSQRSRHHTWSFSQFRQFLEYKAKYNGVLIVLVNPRNTSKTCARCGHLDQRNRKSQSHFECTSCGFVGHADVNAAENISALAAVNQP